VSVLDAAQSGDEAAALEAMRDSLAAAMDEADPAVVAQIAGRLESVLKRLGEVRPAKKVTLDDALAARRASREQRPKSAGRSGGKPKRAG
jgi:hypothetical protein